MIVRVQRLFSTHEESISNFYINGDFYHFIIEDEKRAVKLYGETRIDAGDYDCKLLKSGRHHNRYKWLFSAIHEGMIWLRNVPKFTGILYHIGNYDWDTKGCICPGMYPKPFIKKGENRWMVKQSRKAYTLTYPIIKNALMRKEQVIWQIRD